MSSKAVEINGKSYRIDALGCLVDPRDWDEGFARGTADRVGIAGDLTDDHWKVIRFLRQAAAETGRSPLVYQACKANGLTLRDMQRLFPTGYQRGACKLAGLNYDESYASQRMLQAAHVPDAGAQERMYRVDAHGYLADAHDWDERFAVCKAIELGLAGDFTDRHWKVVRYLRDAARRTRRVPTVYETCEANGIELEDLEALFPSGYSRGAVKIAGLRPLTGKEGDATT
jgi:tRNA 2-thiouridine synthesizing protein E